MPLRPSSHSLSSEVCVSGLLSPTDVSLCGLGSWKTPDLSHQSATATSSTLHTCAWFVCSLCQSAEPASLSDSRHIVFQVCLTGFVSSPVLFLCGSLTLFWIPLPRFSPLWCFVACLYLTLSHLRVPVPLPLLVASAVFGFLFVPFLTINLPSVFASHCV